MITAGTLTHILTNKDLKLNISEYPKAPLNWDSTLLSAGSESNFLQTSFWATLIQQMDKAKPVFLEVKNGNDLISSLMVLHRVPYDRISGQIKRGIRSYIRGTHRGWLDLSGGPVFYDHELAADALKLILDWIERYSSAHRLRLISMSGFSLDSRYVLDEDINKMFLSYGYKMNPWATYLVDLSCSEEEMWSNLAQAARKGVKKARRNGVIVENIKTFDEYAVRFHDPYKRSRESAGASVAPLSLSEIMWNHPGHDNYYRYYVAEDQDGTALGMLGMFVYNGVASEIMSELTPEAYSRKAPAQDILHWEMFLKAKQMGCRIFDLAGVSPRPADKKEEGIRKFKEKWGGRYIEYNTFRKETLSGLSKVLTSINRLRNRWL